MPASIFSETELARLASFPEEIPGDDLIRAFTLTGADRDLVAIRRGAANRLGLALQLCALRYLGFVPRNLSAAPAIGRLLCRGPARGQPGRDSILRSTRADALHSTSPRFGNTSASRCSGHGTWKNSKLGLSNEPLSTMLRRFSFASHVSGCAPRGSSFQHPAESYDLPVRRGRLFALNLRNVRGTHRNRYRAYRCPSEAHDSGLCLALPERKREFARDIRNLTLSGIPKSLISHAPRGELFRKRPILIIGFRASRCPVREGRSGFFKKEQRLTMRFTGWAPTFTSLSAVGPASRHREGSPARERNDLEPDQRVMVHQRTFRTLDQSSFSWP